MSQLIKIKGRMNYLLFNYCVRCKLQFDKTVAFCSECGKRTRNHPRETKRYNLWKQRMQEQKTSVTEGSSKENEK